MTAPTAPTEPNDAAGRCGAAPRCAVACAVPFAVLATLVAAFLWDVLLAGRAFVMRDQVFDFLPWRRFAADAAREGAVPLWNPASRFGQPFVANPQSAFFYPPHHLFDVLPVRWALAATIAFHLFVAAAGMFALLRSFGLAAGAAVLGGATFAFGTYFTANLEFMSVMDTLAWAPLTVLLACRATDAATSVRAAARPVVRLAAVVALQALAGQVQVLAYSAVAAAVVAATLAVAERRNAGPGWVFVARGTALAVAGLLALGLACIQVVPTLELVPHSVRAGALDPGLDIASMPARHLATLFFPLAFGRPGAAEWWSPSLFEFWLGCVHVGVVPLVCATAALLPRRDGNRVVARLAFACAALCVAGVVIAMGKHTPVFGLLQALPGADKFRWPAKGLQLTAIGLAALAAIGFDGLLARRDAALAARRRADRGSLVFLGAWAAVAAVVVALALTMGTGLFDAIAGTPVPRTSEIDGFLARDVVRTSAFLALGLAVLGAATLRAVPRAVAVAAVVGVAFVQLHLVSRDVQWVGDPAALTPPVQTLPAPQSGTPGHLHTAYGQAGFLTYGARDAAPFALAASLYAGETGLPAGVSRTYGGDALQVARVVEVVDLLDGLPPATRSRLADVLAVDREIRGAPFDEVAARGAAAAPRAALRPTALPRAFLADRWVPIGDPVDAVQRLLAPDFDIRRTVVEDTSSGAPPLPASPAAPGVGPAGRVLAVRPGRDRVEVDVRTDRACLLVLCETWLPGWTATVDGGDVPVRRVNVLFRGVPLPAGAQRVTFVYAPRGFRIGAAVSAIALAAAAALWVLGRRRPLTTGASVPS